MNVDTTGGVTVIKLNELENTLKLYPSPANNHIWVEDNTIKAGELYIIDIDSKIVARSPFYDGKMIEITHLAPGIYYASLYSGKSWKFGRFIGM